MRQGLFVLSRYARRFDPFNCARRCEMEILSLEQTFRRSSHIIEDVMTYQELESLIKNEVGGPVVFGMTRVAK